MKNNPIRYSLHLAFLLGTLLFPACTRSASTQPAFIETPQAVSPIPQIESSTPVFPATPLPTSAPQPSTKTPPPDEVSSPEQPVEEAITQSGDSEYMGQHIVQSGETLYMIGRAYEVLPEAIAEANDIANPDSIDPGMILNIPRMRWENVPSGPIAKKQFTP